MPHRVDFNFKNNIAQECYCEVGIIIAITQPLKLAVSTILPKIYDTNFSEIV